MVSTPSPHRKIHALWLTISYLLALTALSWLLIRLGDHDWALFIMVVPILLCSLDYPRRVYLPLLGALAVAAVIVTSIISSNFQSSLRTIVMVIAVISLATEVIRRKVNEWLQSRQELKENADKYSTVFRTSPDVIVLTRLSDGQVLEVNDSFEKLSGYSAQEAIGQTITGMGAWVNQEDRIFMRKQLEGEGTVAAREVMFRRKDGNILTALLSSRLIDWRGTHCVFTILRDITERKQLEEAMRQSEARNQALLNAIPDTMFRIHRDGEYLDFQSHDHTQHTKAAQYIGKTLSDLLPEDLAEASLEAIRAALDTGEIQQMEYHLDRNNKSRDFEARLAVSGPDEVLSIVRDITQRKLSEQRLKQAEERYRHLVEQVESIIYISERGDTTSNLYISPQVENLLGYSAEEWENTPDFWLSHIHPDDLEAVRAEHLRTNESGEAFRMEYRMTCKDGRFVWLEDHAALVPDEKGELTRWQGVFFDITARKRSEMVQSATYRIAQAALATKNLHTFYDSVHQILLDLIPANNMYIALYDQESDVISFPYWSDERDPRPEPEKPIRGLTEYVLRTDETQLVNIERFKELIAKNEVSLPGIGSMAVDWLGTPLKMGDRTIGVLAVQTYASNNRLGVNEQHILEFVSGQIAMTTERIRAEEALRESEERFALAVQGANDGIWDWNLRTNEVYYSLRWKTMLGFDNDNFGCRPDDWFSRIHPQDLERVMSDISAHLKNETDSFECEYRLQHADGSYRWVLNRGLAVRDDGQTQRMAGSMTDITARKAVEDRLLHDAMHDPLTNLSNRPFFMNLLTLVLERISRLPNYTAAVLFMDLDRFKIVNESLGHKIGDQLLIGVAERITGCLRPGDTLARLGGDEFAVLLDDIQNISEASLMASSIQAILAPPFNFQGHEVFTSVTIGVVKVDDHYDNAEDLMRDVDSATYRAKANGRGSIEIFNTQMHTSSMAILQLEADLRRAIEREEFRLYYQPIVALRERKVRSFEALLRWQHPSRGIIMPGEFISLAEDTGLILPIGEWVLRTACNQLKVWQKAGFDPIKVSVNIATRQLQDQDLVQVVGDILKQTGVNGDRLQLEITEYTAMRDLNKTTQVLNELTRMGIEILIDDFGTGYSSMGYLKRFPVNYLKIAQVFIRDVNENPDDAAITSAIIVLAHAMDRRVIAEGVENQAQFNFLLEQDCDEIQGYYINPAMPGVSTTRFLQSGLEDRMGSM